MNDIQNLIDRQLGLPCRYGYDSVLRRLVVREAESFHGLGAPGADDPPIFACRFAEAAGSEHILALANEDGRVAVQDTSKSNSESSLQSYQCHNNAVFDLAWMPGHTNFVTVSGDHTACLWDLETGTPRRVAVFARHTRSVKCCVFPPGHARVFATGARDGHVLVWDTRVSGPVATVLRPENVNIATVLRPDNSLLGCHSSAAPRTPASHGKRARLDTPRPVSITGLVFQDENTLLTCGECDGNIKVWDLRKNYSACTREPLPKHSLPYGGASTRHGYTSLALDSARTRLYASCLDQRVYCYNVAGPAHRPERRYFGHQASSFYLRATLSSDGKYLASGSSDKYAYIWNVDCSQPIIRLEGHRAEVTCVAWAKNCVPTLVTCSDDARHMIWRVGSEVEENSELRGRAEIVPKAESDPQLDNERTPATRKRHQTPTPSSAKRLRLEGQRRGKRCLADLLNAARDSDEATSSKRARASSPAPIDPPLLPAGTKRPCPSVETDSPKRSCLEDADRHVGFTTPTKRNSRSPLSPCSPSKLNQSPGSIIRSFISELPDFAVDGQAPHLRLMSPGKRKVECPDWLTRLVQEKRARVDPSGSPINAPASPKENAPPRRGSVSERTPKTSAKSTLLKYFTVAPKEKKVQ